MEPAEVEFLAEREIVKIVPNFSSGTLYLLGGDFGPFKPGLPLQVPLWVAVHLRQRQKCRILAPDWMNLEILEESKNAEKEEALFTKLPNPRLFVVSNLLLDVAAGDFNQVDDIKTIIKDIWDVRQSKLRKIVDSFVLSGSLRATLNHVQLIEINSVRPLLPETINHIHRLEMAGSEASRARAQSQTNTTADRSMLSHSLY